MPLNPVDLLDRLDWQRYEAEVVAGVRQAVGCYVTGKNGSQGAPVCGVSVWTDPQALLTAVGFETVQHRTARGGPIALALANDWDGLLDFLGPGHAGDFDLREFLTVEHPCLRGLEQLDLRDAEVENAVLARIEQSLLDVRERVFQARLLDALPRGSHLWFGTNSPVDWFDHVVEVPSR